MYLPKIWFSPSKQSELLYRVALGSLFILVVCRVFTALIFVIGNSCLLFFSLLINFIDLLKELVFSFIDFSQIFPSHFVSFLF